VLGPTGRNFAAGMSGGIAYVLDLDPARCNQTLVGLEPIDAEDARRVHALVSEHVGRTGSTVKLDLSRLVKVIPHEYKRVLEQDIQFAEAA